MGVGVAVADTVFTVGKLMLKISDRKSKPMAEQAHDGPALGERVASRDGRLRGRAGCGGPAVGPGAVAFSLQGSEAPRDLLSLLRAAA